jgi:hypothetical protein
MALSNTSSFPDQNGRDPLSFADQQDGHIPATAPALPGRPAPGPSRAAADAGTCTLTSAATVKPAHGPPRTMSVPRSVGAAPVRGPSVKKPTVHTDHPDGTDARPLCVRGHRNMTVYSDTR